MKQIIAAGFIALSASSPAIAGETIKYYSSKLLMENENQYLAYVRKMPDGSLRYKVRYRLGKTLVNVASGPVGFTFESTEGRFYLEQSEAEQFFQLHKQIESLKKDLKASSEDILVQIEEVGENTKIVFNLRRHSPESNVYIYTPISQMDSPLEKTQPGVINFDVRGFNKMIEAMQEAKSKAEGK